MKRILKNNLALKILCLLAVPMFQSCGERSTDASEVFDPPKKTYLEKRATFQTQLLREVASPQHYRDELPPEGVEEIWYPSGDLRLKAWIHRPAASDAGSRQPALIYYHGGYAFGLSDLMDCQVFIDAGFVVMTPMLRGENGNPGNFEMYFGEVDDARAALNWLAEQDYVDSDHIYAFGHSAGGVISALLSLYEEPHLRFSGSSGGLYGQSLFINDEKAPFDTTQERERELRCLIGNIEYMYKRHYAYVGIEDYWQELDNALSEVSRSPGMLELIVQQGDHFSILPQSFSEFLEVVREDMGR